MSAPRRRGATLAPALLMVIVAAACVAPSASPPSTPTIAPTPSPPPTASPAPTLAPTPTPAPLDQALLGQRFTILLLGADSSAAREAAGLVANTDAIIVVSISADQSQIVQLSVPRDMVDVPLGDGTLYRRKVNGISAVLGPGATRDAIAALLGIQIDAYLQVDMEDFTAMVDAVRGLTLNVPAAITDPKVHLDLEAGWQHLTGAETLAYARTRVDSDFGRAARQQLVARALAAKYAAPGTVFDLPALLGVLDSVHTDLDLATLPTLIEIARRSSSATVVAAQVLAPPRFSLFAGIEPGTTRGWIIIPDVDEIRAYARSLIPD